MVHYWSVLSFNGMGMVHSFGRYRPQGGAGTPVLMARVHAADVALARAEIRIRTPPGLSCKLLITPDSSSMGVIALWARQWEGGRSRDQGLTAQAKK